MTASFNIAAYTISHRYPHIAAASGDGRLAEYLGQPVKVSRFLYFLGETVIRLPAKLTSWYGGSFEYSRHDFVKELAAIMHMSRHSRSVYHFFHAEKSFLLSGFMSRKRHNRFVGTFHHPPSHFDWLFRSTDHLKALSHAIAISSYQVDFLEQIFGQGRVTVVPLGIDTDYYTPSDEPLHDRRLRCICVGTHMRDFDSLPTVVSGVLDAVPGAEFVIVSGNRKCEAAAQHERARWLRGIPDEEYRNLVRTSDLLVLPLLESTAVTAVLEALACGVPVVTNRGGICDYLDDECSVVIDGRNPAAMVETACKLLRNRNLRRRMAAAARKKSLQFTWTEVAKQTMDVYRRTLAQ